MTGSELDGVVLRNEANERALEQFVKILRNEQPLLLVGAGSSFRVSDYPMWGALLKDLEQRIIELSPRSKEEVLGIQESEDMLWRAGEARRLLGESEFIEFIRMKFGPREPTHTPFHERLLALPWQHVFVTNYDPVLEYAHTREFNSPAKVVVWNESRNVEELIARSHLPTYERRYVYVHGRYDRDGIILTERDYQERYHKHRELAERLFNLLDAHTMASVGFSMTDFDLLTILRRKQAFREGTPRHFALLGDPGKNVDIQRRMFRDKYGIEPIYYPVDNSLPARERHIGLDRLVEWLHTQLKPPTPTGSSRASGKSTPTTPKSGTNRAEKLAETIRGLDWHEQTALIRALLHEAARSEGAKLRFDSDLSDRTLAILEAGTLRGVKAPAVFTWVSDNNDNRSLVLIGHSHAEVVWITAARTPLSTTPCWTIETLVELLDAVPALRMRYLRVRGDHHLLSLERPYRAGVAKLHEGLRTLGLPSDAVKEGPAGHMLPLRDVFVPMTLRRQTEGTTIESISSVLLGTNRVVVLGDPGTGKTTLLRFLTLLHSADNVTLDGCAIPPCRIGFFISLRDYVKDRADHHSTFVDHLANRSKSDLSYDVPKEFFEAVLHMGEAAVFLDGLDETGNEAHRTELARCIESFCERFPFARVWVTSRVFGYNRSARLRSSFSTWRLEALDSKAIERFVDAWYTQHQGDNPRECHEGATSLKRAIRVNPGVQRLAGNPLLLTLMSFIHLTSKHLPEDRGELYEKCIEMLLKSWLQNRDPGTPTAPMCVKHMTFQAQKAYLAVLAMEIQQRESKRSRVEIRHLNPLADELDRRGLIGYSDAVEVLAKHHVQASARERVTELDLANARDEMKSFLDWNIHHTGLVSDKGAGQIAFYHLSFQEYLSAWHYIVGETGGDEQLAFFEAHMCDSAWQEVLLLRLYIVIHSGRTALFDRIVKHLLNCLAAHDRENGWKLLARALCDNLTFRPAHVDVIMSRAFVRWRRGPRFEGEWFGIFRELAATRGRTNVQFREFMRRQIKIGDKKSAIAAVELLNRLSGHWAEDVIPWDALEARADRATLVPALTPLWHIQRMAAFLESYGRPQDWLSSLRSSSTHATYEITYQTLDKDCGHTIGWWWLIDTTFRELGNRAYFAKRHHYIADALQSPTELFYKGSFHEVRIPMVAFRATSVIRPVEPWFPTSVTEPEHDSPSMAIYTELSDMLASRLGDLVAETINTSDSLDQKFVSVQRLLRELFGGDFIRGFARGFVRYLTSDFINDVVQMFGSSSRSSSVYGFERYFVRYFVKGFDGDLGRAFVNAFGHAFQPPFSQPSVSDFLSNFELSAIRPFVVEFGRAFIRRLDPQLHFDFGPASLTVDERFMKDIGFEAIGRHPEEHWKSRCESESFIASVIAHPFFCNNLSLLNLGADLKFMLKKTAASTSLGNPLAALLLGTDLIAIQGTHAFLGLLRDLSVRYLHGALSLAQVESQAHKVPMLASLVGTFWEGFAHNYEMHYEEIRGGRGAMFMAQAALAAAMSGYECSEPAWQRLAASRDRSDPMIEAAFLLREVALNKNSVTNARALRAILERIPGALQEWRAYIDAPSQSDPSLGDLALSSSSRRRHSD